ncbi:MAG: DUF1830 domain-containing protein [Prochlorothrix sp.]|nr:DUF1830 domain-containing protein [Prochlorothrix sp.]
MAQILDPLPVSPTDTPLLCCYVNATSKIQIARITNIPNWYFERVVFPGQRLVFEAVMGSQLEIHTGMMASAILSDRIPCEQLLVQEDQAGAATTEAPVAQSGGMAAVARVSDTVAAAEMAAPELLAAK